ncbi:Asp23/Gls24 family envelope stress response protein [Micromonospora arborensis]|uniref:Asp23/Gls24 family envelope stress response protein n=1 Tax=Micromonospora arborensis TaxID=2116518 RepID=UPI003423165D
MTTRPSTGTSPSTNLATGPERGPTDATGPERGPTDATSPGRHPDNATRPGRHPDNATGPAREPTDGADIARIAVQAAGLVPGVSVVRPAAVRLDDRSVGLDLHLITWYGHSVPTIAETVRAVVADRVAATTGLRVAVVTVTVDDLLVPGVDVSAAPAPVPPEDG